ncbi:MAG: hypothetical protein SVU32_05340, partial [Candidatus Nanohaloarchaea archaeon]|nr:hypothetical protein [Candidatus Nanohaloarchaea archaeon]
PSPLDNSTKGLSILSEAILAIGVIAIAIMFALITGNIIGFQSQGFFTGSQQEITDDISSRIDMISAYNGTTAITYQPTVSQYRLRVTEQSIISVQLPNQGTQSTSFEDVKLENTRIEDAETLCIRKKGQKIAITAGNCSTTQLSNFCANGRCINGQCQPERGETCGNAPADCSCPTPQTVQTPASPATLQGTTCQGVVQEIARRTRSKAASNRGSSTSRQKANAVNTTSNARDPSPAIRTQHRTAQITSTAVRPGKHGTEASA